MYTYFGLLIFVGNFSRECTPALLDELRDLRQATPLREITPIRIITPDTSTSDNSGNVHINHTPLLHLSVAFLQASLNVLIKYKCITVTSFII